MPQVKISTQAAVLRPTPGSEEVGTRSTRSRAPSRSSRDRGARRALEDRLDPRRLLLAQAARAGSPPRPRRPARRALPPSREALAQRGEGAVAVAVVGVLGEHRLDQLGDRVPVRLVQRLPYISRNRSRIARTRRFGSLPIHRRDPMSGIWSLCDGAIEEGELGLDGVNVFYRRVPGEGTPAVYCHGNPTHGEDWLPFLGAAARRSRSTCPAGAARTIPTPTASTTRCTGSRPSSSAASTSSASAAASSSSTTGAALALIGAQRRPELVEKLVILNVIPLLPGYRWHWVAQIWRRRGLGELANATTTKRSMWLIMRQALADRRPMPPQFVDTVWGHLDNGTSDATLALYRHADPDRLAQAGRDLDHLYLPRTDPLGRAATSTSGPPSSPTRSPRSFPTPRWRSSRAPATGPGSTTKES